MVAAYDPAQGVVICVANPAWEQWAALQLSNPLLPPPMAHRRAGEQVGVEIGSTGACAGANTQHKRAGWATAAAPA